MYTLYMSNAAPAKRKQGMNWIRKEKRLAIYLRDGLACCYCGQSIEDGTKLTLDHLKPYSKGGSNDATNLVTCCAICNSKRGNRTVKAFAAGVAHYAGQPTTETILAFIKTTTRRKLDMNAALELIARRGGFVAACKA